MFGKACEAGLEGIISKRAGAPYVAGRQKRWLTVRDTYAVQIAAGVEPLLIIGAVLALDIAMEREANADAHE